MMDMGWLLQEISRRQMIIDRDTIRKRVYGRDAIYSAKVVLVALIKGSAQSKKQILGRLEPHHIGRSFDQEVFRWLANSVRSGRDIDLEVLLAKTKDYIQKRVLPGERAVLDELPCDKVPNADEIDVAVGVLHDFHDELITWDCSSAIVVAEKTMLTALINCDNDTRRRILRDLSPDHINHLGRNRVFEDAMLLLQESGSIKWEDLLTRTEDFVWKKLFPNYLVNVGHLFVIDEPDEEVVSRAVELLIQKYIDMRKQREWHKNRGWG